MSRLNAFAPAARHARVIVAGLAATLAIMSCQSKSDSAKPESTVAAPAAPPTIAVNPPVSTLSEFGYGPIRAGLTYAAANDSVKGSLKAASNANLAECDYVKWEGGPPGLNVMVVEGKIARVDVSDSSVVSTDLGARIGDAEERIHSLYGNRVTVTNHKYEDGHYLTVRSADATDTLHLIIFETAKGKVTRMRGGARPGVEYIEGCS